MVSEAGVRMERPQRSELARHWGLDPEIVFLNHGSFGACPRAVLSFQLRLRERLEAEPVRFFVREYQDALDAARCVLSRFVGCDHDGLAFVTNATTGVNTLLRSLVDLAPGDEVLITDHEYPACRNAVARIVADTGARVVVARVPFPLTAPAEVVEAVRSRIGRRTRLVLIDHVTSQTGLIFPVAEIAAAAHEAGALVIVDGAHAPGMLELGVSDLGVDGYVGNCHKWLCAPKGAAFLWVAPEHRQRIRPLVVSHGATAPPGGRFRAEMDWTGTGDPTPWLAVPEAIKVMNDLVPGGWPDVRRRNRDLVLEGRRILCTALGIAAPAPDNMIGALASVPLSDGSGGAGHAPIDPLQDVLWQRFHIEVPVISWPAEPRRLLRISAQLYNSVDEYRYLAEAVALC